MEQIQNTLVSITNDEVYLDSAQIELAFIAATRNDSKADRAFCRGEFLDFILRLAHIKYRKIMERTYMNKTAFQMKKKKEMKNVENKVEQGLRRQMCRYSKSGKGDSREGEDEKASIKLGGIKFIN